MFKIKIQAFENIIDLNKPISTECTSCGVTLIVEHLMTEFRLNEDEREIHNILTIVYEIIRFDCQSETSCHSSGASK